MQSALRVHVIIFLHVGLSLNIVFLLIDLLGTNSGIVFDDEENCHQKKIKRAFEDTEFSQPDVAEMDDDDSWLRQNDDFVRMSAKSYVSNLTISP
jgi:hypothetical protein